jgi:hypothetical protein
MKSLSKPIKIDPYLFSFTKRLCEYTKWQIPSYLCVTKHEIGRSRIQILTNLNNETAHEIFK